MEGKDEEDREDNIFMKTKTGKKHYYDIVNEMKYTGKIHGSFNRHDDRMDISIHSIAKL